MSLRGLLEKDAEGMLEWMNDPEILKNFRFGAESRDKNDIINFIKEASVELIEGKSIHYAIVDENDELTEKFYADKKNKDVKLPDSIKEFKDSIIEILTSVYSDKAIQIENARSNNVELHIDRNKLAMPEFKALWQKINAKSVYVVDFNTDELIKNAVNVLNAKLRINKIYFKVETGVMEQIESKEALEKGNAFIKEQNATYESNKKIAVNSSVKYDLIGKLVEATGLTRKDIVKILTGIEKPVFDQFKDNPEEFIIKAAGLINDEKATAVIQHITYDMLDEKYDTDIFTEPTMKGKLGTNVVKTKKHLYDHVLYDSANEKNFAQELDTNKDVAVYVKLPNGFYISTPVGKYNPDWAIAFYEGSVKHIYFVAETVLLSIFILWQKLKGHYPLYSLEILRKQKYIAQKSILKQ